MDFAKVRQVIPRCYIGRRQRDKSSKSGLLTCFFIAVVAAVLFFGQSRHGLLEPEEARYAEIPRQMLAQRSYLIPVLHGEPYLQKPPLLYWLTMLSYEMLGVSDAAARMIPSLAGVLLVLMTFFWARSTLGPRGALFSAVILCLGPRFLYQASMLNFDGLLSVFVVAGWMSAHLARIRRRYPWWLFCGAAAALGVLTKGPVALALIFGPVAIWLYLDGRGIPLRLRDIAAVASTILAIAGPWFAVMTWRDPEASGTFFWLHNLVRYLAPFDHEKPTWFYVPALLLGMLPWSILLFPMGAYLMKRSTRWARRRPPALAFYLTTFVFCVTLFSLSGCKRPGYILPAYPALALCLGSYLDQGLFWGRRSFSSSSLRMEGRVAGERGNDAIAWTRRILALLISTTFGIGLALIVSAAAFRSLDVTAFLLAFAVLLALACVYYRGRESWSPRERFTILAASLLSVLVGADSLFMDAYHVKFGMRTPVVTQGNELDESMNVVCYPRRWDSVSFYLQRNDVTVYSADERDELIELLMGKRATLLFVKVGPAFDDLKANLPPTVAWRVAEPHGENVVPVWISALSALAAR